MLPVTMLPEPSFARPEGPVANLTIIVARDRNGVIGCNGELPWRLPSDLRFFRDTTTGHAVIMGRKTFESLPASFRPLPGRHNVILTRNSDYSVEGATVCHSLGEAIRAGFEQADEVFVVGGGETYVQALEFTTTVLETVVDTETQNGDAVFPELGSEWSQESSSGWQQDGGDEFRHELRVWRRR